MKWNRRNVRPHPEPERRAPARLVETAQDRAERELGAPNVLLALLLLAAPAHAATQIGSVPYRGSATAAGNSHSPVFSADGRHVAFVSQANNLVTNDDLGPHLDLFVRDLVTSNTALVSVSTNDFGGANDNVALYTFSSYAQFIAFETPANNLAPGDTNRVSDIYVRDLLAGTTRLVSVNADGNGSGNGPSSNPLISEDGRYVIFESLASNLVTNDFNGTNDIFIHDLTTGVTELVSVNADGTASPDGASHSPSISADGLTVAFVSHATNLVEGVTNRLGEVYVRRIAAGATRWAVASHLAETRRDPTSANPWRWPPLGSTPVDPYVASEPVLSADGRYVAFKTQGSFVRFDLSRETNYIHLAFTNLFTIDGARVDFFQFADNPRVAPGSTNGLVALSADFRWLAYPAASSLSPYPGIRQLDWDNLTTNISSGPISSPSGQPITSYLTNVVPVSAMVVTNFAPEGSIERPGWTRLTWLGLNADGQRLFFGGDLRTNYVPLALPWPTSLCAVDLPVGSIRFVITNATSGAGADPELLPNGSLIAWDSPDDTIVADDLNRAWDVFVRNVDTGETQLISARDAGLPAASGIALSRLDQIPGAISANGQRIAMLSLDNTLVPDDTNNWRDLIVRDLVTGTNFDVSRSIGRVWYSPQTNFPGTNTAGAPSLSADGRFVAFAGDALFFVGSTNRAIYWRDLQAPTNRVVVDGNQNNPGGVSYPALSSDGRLLAFHSAGNHDLYYSDGNGQSDVFVRLMRPNPPLQDCSFLPFLYAPLFISVAAGTTTTADGPSVNPAFSPDAGWVLFQSRAANLLRPPIAAQSMYQLYKRGVSIISYFTNACGQVETLAYTPTDLISYTTSAAPGPSGTSTDLPLAGGAANPRFSADSRYVAFESGPNLIYRHDLLGGWVTNILTHPDPMFPSLTNRARFTNDLVCTNCASPTLSADGRFVAYQSSVLSGPIRHVSVKDLQTGQEELISVNLSGSGGGNDWSSTPLISYDARFVVFASKASDLVPGDNNRVTDIFVRDRLNHVTHCLSRNFAGTGTGNRVSSNPIMSADGRTVAFQSFASDIVPGDYNDTRDVFVVTLGGPDTDGDHMDDDWEMAYFSTLDRDGSGDFDNDGASDLAEFRAGTNPANDASILRVLTISAIHRSAYELSQATLVWSAVPGRTYRVQFRDNLTGTPWMDVPGDVVATSTSASKTYVPAYYTGFFTNRRFYRVLLVQ